MDTKLRLPLIINAVISFGSGVLLLAAPGIVGGWLAVDIDGWLRVIGAVLIAHGLMLGAGLSKMDMTTLAKLNLAMIAPYPVLMVVIVVTGLVSRPLGQGLVLLDGAIIAGIAAWHLRWLRGARSAAATQRA